MPITQSAKKALRQSERRRAKNNTRKDALRARVRELKRLIAAKKMDEAKNALTALYQAADKAAKTNVIHPNRAARIKSRFSRLIQ